jgi:ParB family transcriptional regulator, chromosome partitioning protein
MSRKNPFANLDLSSLDKDAPSTRSNYGMTGAAKTVVRSIEEMAENTKRLMDGETIVEIEPQLLDVSFASDRLSEVDSELICLRDSIREHGQTTPILVRPNPQNTERYMVVFGHRRARVALDLGLRVKAVIKKLDDTASAIAQGQENSARSNLSFIERAYFAQNLIASGLNKDVVKSAIGIDDAMLSKMLSVIETVPSGMLITLGSAKKIGRDKWLSLRQIILNPAHLSVALEKVGSESILALPEEERFDALHDYLKKYSKRSVAKAAVRASAEKSWSSEDKAIRFSMKQKQKGVSVELSSVEAKPFGDWLADNLERFYSEYRESKIKTKES